LFWQAVHLILFFIFILNLFFLIFLVINLSWHFHIIFNN
jgi:hypothetical protein